MVKKSMPVSYTVMAWKGAASLLLSINLIAAVSSQGLVTIKVSKNGRDTKECKSAAVERRPPCRTLDFVFDGGSGLSSNTKVVLESGNFVLKNDTRFENLNNISLIGGGSSYVNFTITCTSDSIGLSFFRCHAIVIQGIHVKSCGRKRNGTLNQYVLYSAIHFVFSKEINISNAAISDSKGTGLIMLDVGGRVTLERSDITKNIHNGSGGGVFIATTSCGALDLINCTSQKEQQEYIHGARFLFKDSRFTGNIHNKTTDNLFEETHEPQSVLGRAGGLTLHLSGNASQNQFTFITCSFNENEANWGGGIYIGMNGIVQNNTMYLYSGMTFWNNKALLGGGAVQITLLHKVFPSFWKENIISFSSVYFGNNRAIWGGAVSVKANTRILKNGNLKMIKSLLFNSCVFSFNIATVGSAIALATNNLNYYTLGPGVSYALALDNSFISFNTISTTEDKGVIGQGSVYAEQFMLYMNTTLFKNNTGTALVLESSSLLVQGNVTFLFNQGLKGGAVALYGGSLIRLTKDCQLFFQKNKAEIKGGAIYVKTPGPSRLAFTSTKLATSKCFFLYEDQIELNPFVWECKIIFMQNSAPDATGNSIFANSLQTCRLKGEPRMKNKALEWPNVFVYSTIENSTYPEIATEAIEIISNWSNWQPAPSVPFTPGLVLLDEKGNSVYGTIKVNITSQDDPKLHLDPPNNVFLMKDAIHDIRLVGHTGANFSLNFLTTDGQLVKTITTNQSLGYCPPGFRQTDKSSVCKCMEEEKAITRCDNYTAFLLRGYWGHINKKHKFSAFKCPKHYCHCSYAVSKIPYECPYTALKCSTGRTGLLCGRCKTGYSVKLGNEKCGQCSNIYLLLLIPIILVASLFVLFIFYFNVDAFSGYLNAFLYSYQSIDTVLPETINLDPFIAFVIGTLCLSGTGNTFGVCMWDGFTDLQKLGFNLGVPLYILLFTILVGTCLSGRVFEKFFGSTLRSRSFGRALSFVYTYCYTALTSKALALLNPITIDNKLMVYSAAEVEYFGKEHIGYAILAILILIIFTVGFPVVLLFTPFFTERVPTIARMSPAFDVLKLCFKNPLNHRSGYDYRPFAAFYFIARLVLLLFDIFVKDETPRLVLIAVSSVLFQVIFTWFQPYVIWTMNFWDMTLLTNMCFISLVSIISSVPYILSKNYRLLLEYVLKVLVYLPLIVVAARLFVYWRAKLNRLKRRGSTITEDEVPAKRTKLRMPFLAKRRARSSRIPRRLHEDEPSELSEVGHV